MNQDKLGVFLFVLCKIYLNFLAFLYFALTKKIEISNKSFNFTSIYRFKLLKVDLIYI